MEALGAIDPELQRALARLGNAIADREEGKRPQKAAGYTERTKATFPKGLVKSGAAGPLRASLCGVSD